MWCTKWQRGGLESCLRLAKSVEGFEDWCLKRENQPINEQQYKTSIEKMQTDQCVKKVLSDSPGIGDFLIELLYSVRNRRASDISWEMF